jgi:hypothetical protein
LIPQKTNPSLSSPPPPLPPLRAYKVHQETDLARGGDEGLKKKFRNGIEAAAAKMKHKKDVEETKGVSERRKGNPENAQNFVTSNRKRESLCRF